MLKMFVCKQPERPTDAAGARACTQHRKRCVSQVSKVNVCFCGAYSSSRMKQLLRTGLQWLTLDLAMRLSVAQLKSVTDKSLMTYLHPKRSRRCCRTRARRPEVVEAQTKKNYGIALQPAYHNFLQNLTKTNQMEMYEYYSGRTHFRGS